MSERKSISRRTAMIAISMILIAQVSSSYALFIGEHAPSKLDLDVIPSRISSWVLEREQPLEPDVAAYLRPDDYIQRDYRRISDGSFISLFVAYFKSLQTAYGPHSPRVCLPGAGWLVRESQSIKLPVPGRPDGIPANKYVLEKGTESILVLYWYQNERRIWANEFEFKLHLLPDLLRYRRSDVSLVRVVIPLGRDASVDPSMKDATRFAAALYPHLLDRFATPEQPLPR
ncbi:MAG: EpsI family protein [Terriglobia bacterium]|nr:MAG: EpsI family protein [Terriglobia bacterium]